MTENYGQCSRCGKNLTADHRCSYTYLDEFVAEARMLNGPAWDDEMAKARKWVRVQLKRINRKRL